MSTTGCILTEKTVSSLIILTQSLYEGALLLLITLIHLNALQHRNFITFPRQHLRNLGL